MGGGLMQLVAYGAQDIYLTGNPQITFFKVVYRRHTNFSIESIEQTFNGTADFGKKVSCTISRNGDLVHRIYLQSKLPDISLKGNAGQGSNEVHLGNDTTDLTGGMLRWVNWVGEKMINFAEIEIGGQRIDKHYGEWLHIWNQLTNQPGHIDAYQRMVGNIPSLTKNRQGIVEDTTINGQRLYIPCLLYTSPSPRD